MQDYLSKWNLTKNKHIATTHMSDIYLVSMQDGTKAILKVLKDTDLQDEENSPVILHYYEGHGSIKVYQHDDQAVLLEYASGEELAAIASKNDLCSNEIICDVVSKLHAKRSKPTPPRLHSLQDWFADLFIEGQKTENKTLHKASIIAQELIDTTTDHIPLHGDLHHHNIINSPRGWLAIDPKGLSGDPCYDLANFFGNPEKHENLWLSEERISAMAQTFERKLGLSKQRILKFAFVHNALSTLWISSEKVNRSKRYALAVKLQNYF